MEVFLDDAHCRANLFPFTEIRHTGAIRVGILTIKEKWELLTGGAVTLMSENMQLPTNAIKIPANLLPTLDSFSSILEAANINNFENLKDIKSIDYPWNISQYNDWALRMDYLMVTDKRKSQPISTTNNLLNGENIFMEEGVQMEFCTLNASEGPIYIGKHTQIMEGSLIRGPFAACDHSVIKMGSKMYSGTTIGPWCVAGGEIKNSVLFSYSNKAHDGYLGDSVIGEWCNLGAGTSNSNLKNTASDVLFEINGAAVNAGFKAGLMMGDYSRAAINTSFNTGTIVGISCNIFGHKTPLRHVPSFTWGESKYELEKAFRDINNWQTLKNKTLSDGDKKKLTQLYNKLDK